MRRLLALVFLVGCKTTPSPETAAAVTPEPHSCSHGDNPLCATDTANAPAAAGPALALPGTTYGAGVTLAETTPVSALAQQPDAWVGKRVRVEGTITEVCKMAGCWFNLAADAGQSLKFKVTDGVMVFPQSAVGKRVVAEGIVRKINLDLEQTKRALAHEAEEQGKVFDPATVTEPMAVVRLDGLGAVIAL